MLSQAVKELENQLLKLNDISYNSIDRLMRKIMKSHKVTAKELHNAFKSKYKKTPDDWIKEKMGIQKENISYTISPKEHRKKQKQEKIRAMTSSANENEAKVAQSMVKGPSLPFEEITLVQKILGEERCGKGMYWCHTNKECKPITVKVDGQTIEPKETGIGKPVAECSHTAEGEKCPVHGTHKCPDVAEESNVVRDANGNLYAEFIDIIKSGTIEEENPCWKGYTQVGMKTKNGKEVPNCVPSKGVPKAKGYKKKNVNEAARIPSQSGNNIFVTLSWRGKYYTIQIFFPQLKIPSRLEVSDEIQKIYPGSRVVTYRVAEFKQGEPLLYSFKGGDGGKLGPDKNYVKPMGEEVDLDEGVVSDFISRVRGRRQVGTTGSGKPIYVKLKPKKSKVTYETKPKSKPKPKPSDSSNTDFKDDPWLRGSPASERRVHYQQLRGEEVEISKTKK